MFQRVFPSWGGSYLSFSNFSISYSGFEIDPVREGAVFQEDVLKFEDEPLDRIDHCFCCDCAVWILEGQDEEIFSPVGAGRPLTGSPCCFCSSPWRTGLAVRHLPPVGDLLLCGSMGGGKIASKDVTSGDFQSGNGRWVLIRWRVRPEASPNGLSLSV